MGLLILNAGCAVKIKNIRFYGDEGNQGAIWFETLSSESGSLSKSDWDALRVGMACLSTDSLAEIKAEIEKLCSAYGHCDYEKMAKALGAFQAHLEKIHP